jgi:endonuclease/exonuclease/phosphatase family metal-dependent hydrolase
VTLNVAGRKDIDARLDKIIDFLNEEGADIVCLQEVTFDDGSNLAHKINAELSKPYEFVQADLAEEYIREGVPQTDGLAILSRSKVYEAKVITLTKVPADENGRPDFHRRIAQLVTLENGTKITNTHLASNNNSHLQFEELLKLAPNDSILAGDFNLPKQKMLTRKEIWSKSHTCSIDIKDYISFPKENQTFDYILMPTNKEIVDIRIIEGLSDHNAIACDVF